MKNTRIDARTGWTIALAHSLSSKLQTVIGPPFSIWSKQDGWELLQGNNSVDAASVDAATKNSIAQILAQYNVKACSETVPFDADDQLLMIPVGDENGDRLLVTGLVSSQNADLARALADATLTSLSQNRELERMHVESEKFIGQVTENFEELSWLRSLAEAFEISDATNNLLQLTRRSLPDLRHLVGGEAIYFFGPAQPADESPRPTGTCPLLFSEGDIFPPEHWVHLEVARAEAANLRQTTVRNFQSGDQTGLRNVVLAPVCKSQHHMGWLVVVNKSCPLDLMTTELKKDEWDKNWFEFGTVEAGLVSTMSTMLATHGRNIELFRQREELLIGVMRTLINAIDAKDSYTCGHSDRVASISRRIAQQLEQPETECQHIHMAGLLHDIGKIGIPDSVLGKPGKLTAEEMELVTRHPSIGFEILKPLERLSFVLPGVLHHHEAVDGSGYPHGLKGEEIPLQARIIAIADSYDAMTSNRPYRDGMPTEKAESILLEGLGRQWDREVGQAFFAALADIREICGKRTASDAPQSIASNSTTVAPAPAASSFFDNSRLQQL